MTTYQPGASRRGRCFAVIDWRRDLPWTSTPLGPVMGWSPSLQTAAALVFAARHPMLLFWGPNLLCLMNKAARRLRGDGPFVSSAQMAWPECWQRLEHDVRSVMGGAPPIWHDEWALPSRGPRANADICFTLTCSPIADPAVSRGVGGVLVLLVESTPVVLASPLPIDSNKESALDSVKVPLRAQGGCIDVTGREQAEGALHQGQKMEALGQLTGGVVHDFNNLLGAMMGSFELIRRKCHDAARVHKLAEAGLLVAERGAKLTSQLLTFSRTRQVELTPVSVAATLDGMADMLQRTLGPRIIVRFDVRCDNRFVLFDRTQLEMAVLNLAINARDAMPNGGRLTIGAGLRTVERGTAFAPGEYVEVAVQDDGVGMTQEVVARAFDPFFTTKDVGKGTGLGLSQVHGIARQAGGAVEIESRPGYGTTIRIVLPCTDAPTVTESEAVASPGREEMVEATILLVDDDKDLRSVVAASLQDLGYRVIEAVDGAEGLMLLERHAPDVLVTDFAMPCMTGAELAASAQSLRPTLPIIFTSGYADALALEEAARWAHCVLSKPFQVSALQTEIESALRVRTESVSQRVLGTSI